MGKAEAPKDNPVLLARHWYPGGATFVSLHFIPKDKSFQVMSKKTETNKVDTIFGLTLVEAWDWVDNFATENKKGIQNFLISKGL